MPQTGRPLKELKLAESDTVAHLKKAYRTAKSTVEQRRIQVIWKLAEGNSREEIAALTAYSKASIVQIINIYHSEGLVGLKDKRPGNSGRPSLLTDEELLLLAQNVRKDYEQGVYWQGLKVMTWLKEELGKEVYEQRAYEYLKAIGMTKQSPRPHHAKADAIKQEIFKKNTS